MTALLTDEQIKKEAARYSNGFGLKDTGHVAQDFAAGAQFAIGIYEARLAELSGRKFLDQPSDLKGIQHEHGCAAFRVDERTGYFSGLPCDCGAQVRWCDLASKRPAEDAKVRAGLVEALKSLTLNVSVVWRAFEPEIKEAVGQSNYVAVFESIDKAALALVKP